MNFDFKKLLSNKRASKSRKSIIGSIVTFAIIGGVISFFFSGGGMVIAIILSIVVLAGIIAGSYFWLNAIDDLPDAID
ncbi:MAG: hypothetical protein FK733_18550 [Asgard group archaeon]|nr:hypothetical protein [Asgard group archaeon]